MPIIKRINMIEVFDAKRTRPLRWLCNSVGMDTKDIAWYFENGYFVNLSLDLNQKIVRKRIVPRSELKRG